MQERFAGANAMTTGVDGVTNGSVALGLLQSPVHEPMIPA